MSSEPLQGGDGTSFPRRQQRRASFRSGVPSVQGAGPSQMDGGEASNVPKRRASMSQDSVAAVLAARQQYEADQKVTMLAPDYDKNGSLRQGPAPSTFSMVPRSWSLTWMQNALLPRGLRYTSTETMTRSPPFRLVARGQYPWAMVRCCPSDTCRKTSRCLTLPIAYTQRRRQHTSRWR